ncbi:MAG: TetR/AcrR family transcriptional regulator [Wenzhouxiangella sp.]
MARNTRQRILDAALDLFNADGEPNVTTNRIADEIDISPGNLHYHFRTKADLIEALFDAFEGRMLELLRVPEERTGDIEDIWLLLHLGFEAIGDYRFLYRDLTDLCQRHRGLHQRFRAILRLTMQVAGNLCDDLIADGRMRASQTEREALLRNIALVSTFWLAFDQVQNEEPQPLRAAWQVMSLLSPHLLGDERAQMEALSREYSA